MVRITEAASGSGRSAFEASSAISSFLALPAGGVEGDESGSGEAGRGGGEDISERYSRVM